MKKWGDRRRTWLKYDMMAKEGDVAKSDVTIPENSPLFKTYKFHILDLTLTLISLCIKEFHASCDLFGKIEFLFTSRTQQWYFWQFTIPFRTIDVRCKLFLHIYVFDVNVSHPSLMSIKTVADTSHFINQMLYACIKILRTNLRPWIAVIFTLERCCFILPVCWITRRIHYFTLDWKIFIRRSARVLAPAPCFWAVQHILLVSKLQEGWSTIENWKDQFSPLQHKDHKRLPGPKGSYHSKSHQIPSKTKSLEVIPRKTLNSIQFSHTGHKVSITSANTDNLRHLPSLCGNYQHSGNLRKSIENNVWLKYSPLTNSSHLVSALPYELEAMHLYSPSSSTLMLLITNPTTPPSSYKWRNL